MTTTDDDLYRDNTNTRGTYRGCEIYRDPPPIGTRAFDWHWYHPDYDGEGDPRHGSAASFEACCREIDDMLYEHCNDMPPRPI